MRTSLRVVLCASISLLACGTGVDKSLDVSSLATAGVLSIDSSVLSSLTLPKLTQAAELFYQQQRRDRDRPAGADRSVARLERREKHRLELDPRARLDIEPS